MYVNRLLLDDYAKNKKNKKRSEEVCGKEKGNITG